MATTNDLPEPPAQYKAIQSYLKVASDIERIDPVVSYWVRFYSTDAALKIDKDTPECTAYLKALILWLEKFKQSHKDNEAVSDQTVGQAHMENFVVALFTKADTLDRNGTANKNTVRMFYMAAVLFEAMEVFGPLTDEMSKRAKYAKFKAAYIQKCLKLGQVPKPGPIEGSDLEDPQLGAADNNQIILDDANPNQTPTVQSNETKDDKVVKPPSEPYIMTPTQPKMPTVLPPTTPSSYKPPPPPSSPAPATPTSATIAGSTIAATKFHATNGAALSAEDLIKGQKYCKFANSALQYDDIPTAVANLEKALKLLTTGQP